MNISDHPIGGSVNVTTHHADAPSAFGKLGDVLLKIGNVIHGGFNPRFHGFAEGIVFLALPRSPGVVGAIDMEEHAVAPVANIGQENEILGDGIKDIAVQDKVFHSRGFVDKVLDDAEVLKGDRKKLRENVIMVTAQVNHLGILFLEFLQDKPYKTRVSFGPVAGSL